MKTTLVLLIAFLSVALAGNLLDEIQNSITECGATGARAFMPDRFKFWSNYCSDTQGKLCEIVFGTGCDDMDIAKNMFPVLSTDDLTDTFKTSGNAVLYCKGIVRSSATAADTDAGAAYDITDSEEEHVFSIVKHGTQTAKVSSYYELAATTVTAFAGKLNYATLSTQDVPALHALRRLRCKTTVMPANAEITKNFKFYLDRFNRAARAVKGQRSEAETTQLSKCRTFATGLTIN